MNRHEPARVVLVGGGYVSVWAARAMRRWAGGRVQVTLIAPDPVHVFHGWTGEVVAGDLPVQAVLTPLAEAVPSARLVRGRVVRVDREARLVSVRSAEGTVSAIPYDHLVVGTGTTDRTESVPGMARHGVTVRGAADLPALLERVAGLRAGDVPPAIVVAGGGLAGVELAAALARRCRGGVTLLHRGGAIGADLAADHPALGRRMVEELTAHGVRVRLGAALAEVNATEVRLADGTALPADVVIAAYGTRARPLPGLDDLPTDPAGRLVVDDRLRAAPGVWAGGDAACVPYVGGGACPASALWAITHGTRIGRSIARTTRGLPAGPYRFRGIGRAASFGPGHGVAELYGVPMTGWLAWVVRMLFFLRYAPSARQSARVAGWWMARARADRPAQDTAGPQVPSVPAAEAASG